MSICSGSYTFAGLGIAELFSLVSPFVLSWISIQKAWAFSLVYISSLGLRLPYVPIYAESPHLRVNIRYITDTYFQFVED